MSKSSDLTGAGGTDVPRERSRHPSTYQSPKVDTVARRISRYGTSVKRCAFIAAGFGGLLVLLGPGDILSDAPRFFAPVILTLALLGVGCVGWAYIPFLMGQSDLEAHVEDGTIKPSDPAEETNHYPYAMHVSYVLALVLLGVASAFMLAGAWWSFVAAG